MESDVLCWDFKWDSQRSRQAETLFQITELVEYRNTVGKQNKMENSNWSKVKKNGIQQQERETLHWHFFLGQNPALVIIFQNAIATM